MTDTHATFDDLTEALDALAARDFAILTAADYPAFEGWENVGEYDPNIEAMVVRRSSDWIVSVAPMLFNNRILLSRTDEYPLHWVAGWCYDKGPAAPLAAIAWNPDTDREPAGYKKVAADSRKDQR
ncbi:hypothetical protein [Aeromicrobium sp. 179-A 4D2 NHS]|uniref:hypothetical protein n=1 Tax=Aeromicrobium sp. 179-A 4D2 NHS TaxID=3142375 RepID=UPI0039A3204A